MKTALIQSNDLNIWNNRAKDLQTDFSESLSKGLRKVKELKKLDGLKIKNWCQIHLKNDFISEQYSLFFEAQYYCTYKIKEKINKAIEDQEWDITKHNKKLENTATNAKLSKDMTKIKTNLNKDQNALKFWCLSTYQKPYKGPKEQDYLDAKEYCVSY